jgi:hypothetical protein
LPFVRPRSSFEPLKQFHAPQIAGAAGIPGLDFDTWILQAINQRAFLTPDP